MSIQPLRDFPQEPVFRAALPRELLASNRRATKRTIDQAMERGYRVIEFDASEVGYIDSSGLGVLVAGAGALQALHGALIVSGVTPKIAELFALTQVDTVVCVRRAPYRFTDDDPAVDRSTPDP